MEPAALNNVLETASRFIKKRLSAIATNAEGIRGQLQESDIRAICLSAIRIIGSIAVLGAILFFIYLVIKSVLGIVLSVLSFLNNPQYAAVATVIKAITVIFVIGLLLSLLQKKPESRTEREQDSMKKTLQRDLFSALTSLAPMYGLERPQNLSDISGFDITPCELIEGIEVYTFSIERNTASERAFEPSRFKQSMIRRLEKMERENMLTTVSPYGFVSKNGENLSSILIFTVEDCGDYVNIRCARTDEDSLALYRRLAAKQASDNITPSDPDF